MYELIHLSGNTYYISGPTNCGVYVLNDKLDVLLFDCGSEIDGEHIYNTLVSNNFNNPPLKW